MEDWGERRFGLENRSLDVRNDARDLQIGSKMGPGRPKSGLGGSRDVQNWFLDGLEGGSESSGLVWTAILGVPRAGLDAILGPLGCPGRRFGGGFGGFGGPKRVRKDDFLDPKWKSAN